MGEEEYYKISEEKELPLRCPILNYCPRRMWTIYLFSEYSKYSPGKNLLQALKADGTMPSDYEEKEIQLQGEGPSIQRGGTSWDFRDVCPEVNLFDTYNALMPGKACVAADYDKFRKTNQKRVTKTQHFSRCAEFNKYLFDENRIPKVRKSRKRKAIPTKMKALLQKEINSECPFCGNQDVGHFHVHHIDENPENNDRANLLMLCPTCHSKITKGDIHATTVELLKRRLSSSK